jgi:hypothetical protein
MPKISLCDRCNFYAHTTYLVCAVHPSGVDYDTCHDFESAELWELEDPSYYKDLDLDDMLWHPTFTGKCPICKHIFSRFQPPPVNWYCPECGWQDK